MGRVRLLCGTGRSERAQRIDALMRDNWGRAALLCPTYALARLRTESLILDGGLPGAWGRPVQTFEDFVDGILRAEGRPARAIGDLERRLLLERAVQGLADTGALAFLGEAVGTPGFINHLLRVITQLKQAAIEPERFRRIAERRKTPSPFDEVVALAYDSYQDALLSAKAYDRVGLFWEAALICRGGPPAALHDTDILVLDQFDDFTPSEFRLLEAIAPHVEEIVFGLCCDIETPSRRDLFDVPIRTAKAVQKTFPGCEVSMLPEPPAETHSQYAASEVFWRNIQPAGPPDIANLILAPCAGVTHEIEFIGRRVKSLLIDEGAAQEEIAVVFRNVDEAAPALSSTFAEFGIPLRIQSAQPLANSALCIFLLSLLESVDTWERAAVADILVSPWFQPDDGASTLNPGAVRELSRAARIVSGRAEWQRRIEHLLPRLEAADDEESRALVKRIPGAAAQARGINTRVATLSALAERISRRALPEQFVDAIESVLSQCRIEDALKKDSAPLAPGVRARELAAWKRLQELLTGLRIAFRTTGHAAPIEKARFLVLFRQALQETGFHPPQPNAGVTALAAQDVRHLEFDYVFFAGVNEGLVPSPPATSAIYTQTDIEDLRDNASLELRDTRTHAARERLLFHHVLASARKHLAITWHTVSREERAASPSPFVDDVRGLFDGGTVESPVPLPADFVPAPEETASIRDYANLAFADGIRKWEAECAEEFARLDALARVENRRHRAVPFDEHDGVLKDPANILRLNDTFGQQHQFSASQLDTYAACPFRYFVERVLEIEQAETPVAEFDARLRGSVMHDVLQEFHAQYRGRPVSKLPMPEAGETLDRLVIEAFDRHARRSTTAPPGLVEAEKSLMRDTLRRYLALGREEDDGTWRPMYFETAFGGDRGRSESPIAKDEPFTLDTGAGPVLLAGRIDRIDESDSGARILDYKTSVHTEPADFKHGRSLQLGLYALALEGLLLPDHSCQEAWFVSVGKPGSEWAEALGRPIGRRKDTREERREAVMQAVAKAVHGIRAGGFPPTPANPKDWGGTCSYCPVADVCRYEPGRVSLKSPQEDEADSETD